MELDQPLHQVLRPRTVLTEILMAYRSAANLGPSRALLHQLVRIGDQAAQDAGSVGEPEPLPSILL